MVESGTYNLIYLLQTKNSKKQFQKKILVSIRQATSCGQRKLLDAFISDGLIECLVKILSNLGDDLLKKIE